MERKKRSLTDLNRLSVEAFKDREKSPIVIVLDNIRSGLNTGSAFRTADAFALEHIYLCGITAKPPHREILKTAIGATEAVNWTYQEDAGATVRQLQKAGYTVYAIEQADTSIPLQDTEWPPTDKIALVFGNEVRGVQQSVVDLVDAVIEVPQFGTKHSLNVSVCLGIVVWDLFKKHHYGA
ncbi:MAG TPA: RNA methyltransferase [Saprospiraceae bacterium]|nr:RNA methyltransferase [Saprospiraceae bacterium]